MKPKYNGIAAVAMGIAALCGIGGYWQSGLWRTHADVRSTPSLQIVPIDVPSESQVRQMRRLYDKLPLLALPRERVVDGRQLTLFGYETEAPVHGGAREDPGRASLKGSAPVLSLTVMAGPQRYCIVEGVLFSEGDTMDNGVQVLKIESHRVLLSQDQERRWIYLDDGRASSTAGNGKMTRPTGPGKGQS